MQQDHVTFPLRWKNVLMAGFFTGFCFLFATSGNIWGPSALVVPTLMGRELTDRDNTHLGLNLAAMGMHLVLSLVYAAIVAIAVRNMRIKMAVLTGGLIGLGLYALNYLMFNYVLSTVQKGAENQAFLTHVIFGMLAAATYTGLTRRTIQRNATIV